MSSAEFEAGQPPLPPRTNTTSSIETDTSRRIDSLSESQSDTDASSNTSDSEVERSGPLGPSILRPSLDQRPVCTRGPSASQNITVSPNTCLDHSQVGLGDNHLQIDLGDELEQRSGPYTIYNDVLLIAPSSDQLTGKPIENYLSPGTPRTWSLQETPDKIALDINHVTPRLSPGKIQRERSTNFLDIPNRLYSPSETSTIKRCAKRPMDDGRMPINPFEQDRTSPPDEDEISVLNLESSTDLEVFQEMQPLPRGAGQDTLDQVLNTSRVESYPKLDQSLFGIGAWGAGGALADSDKKSQQPKVESGPSTPTAIVVTAPGDHKEQAPGILVPTSDEQIRECEGEDVSPQENLGSPCIGLIEKWEGLNLGSKHEGQGTSDGKDANAGYVMNNLPIFGTWFDIEVGTAPRLSYSTTEGSATAYITCGQEPVEGHQPFGDQFPSANLYQNNGFGELDASRGPSGWYSNPSGNNLENAVFGSSIDNSSSGRPLTLDCPFRKRNPMGNNCIRQGFEGAAKLREHIKRVHNAQICGDCFQNHSPKGSYLEGPRNECGKDRPKNMRGLRPYQWFENARAIYRGSDEEKWWQFHFIAFGYGKGQCPYDPWFDQGLYAQFRAEIEDRDIERYDPQCPPPHLPHLTRLTPNPQTGRQSRAKSSASSGQEHSGSSQSGLQLGQTPPTSTSSPLSTRGNGETDAMSEQVQKLEMEKADLRQCLHTIEGNVTRAYDLIQRFKDPQCDRQYSSLCELLYAPFESGASEFVSAWFTANISSPATEATNELSTALESIRRRL